MIQATTPTFILTLPEEVDLSVVQSMYFTLEQGSTVLTKSDDALVIDGQTVSVYMTQEETLKFKTGNANMQLNWTYNNGSRACSNIVNVPVGRNLLKEVVE
jgi:hypothetical protein